MKKAVIIVISVLVVLILFIELVAPRIARGYMVEHAKELIGRKLDIGAIGINIFTGSASIENLTLYEADDSGKFVSFELLDVNASLIALIEKKIEIESILLSNAKYNIIQDGARFNFSDMIEFFAGDTTVQKEPKDSTASAWKVIINNIDISKNYLRYEDRNVGSEWAMHDLSLAIPQIDLSDPNANMGLNLNFAEGGALATNISTNPEDSTFLLNVNIDRFSLAPILPYLKQTILVDTIAGYLTTALDIKGSLQHVLNFDVSGTLAVDHFKLLAPGNANLLSFDSLYNEIKTFNLSAKNIAFGRVYTSGIISQFEIFNEKENTITRLLSPSLNLDSLRNDSTALAQAAIEEQEDTMRAMPRISIDDLCIVNSGAQFIDHTLPQEFVYDISETEVTAPNFVMQGTDNDVHISATLQKTGKMDIRWRGGINEAAKQSISIALNHIDLQSFTPYTLYMFGVPITDGHITVRSQNLLDNRNLDGENHVGIYNPKIGDKDKSITPQMKAPLKLALYILTDKDNSINIDLPVKGNIDSPEFSYGKIILKTFTNLIIKVATSPFSFLKSDPSATEFVDVQPYDTHFSDAQLSTFAAIADVLNKKPEMQLAFAQEIDTKRAVASFSLTHLKKNYYMAQNNLDSTHIEDIIVIERASKIANNDKGLATFTDDKLTKANISLDGEATIEDKAVKLYSTDIEPLIKQRAETRAKTLSEYLTQQCGIENPSITLEYIDIEEDATTRFHAVFDSKE